MRFWIALAAIVCVLVSCSAGAVSREIVIAMDEYRFLPNVIELAPGERVRLTLRDIGRSEHDFVADQRGQALGVPTFHLSPGQSQSRDWTAPNTPVEVAVTCQIPGHLQAGMTARIVVR